MAPAEQRRVWEARLEREGLAVVEGSPIRGGRDSHIPMTPETLDENITAVEQWMAWAAAALRHPMRSRERRVWTLYAEGTSTREIEVKLGLEHRQVTRAIASVKARVEPPPCPDPWRHGGPDADHDETVKSLLMASPREVTAKVAALALKAAPREKLAELFEGDETLTRLLPPKGYEMEPQKKTTPLLSFSKISLRYDLEIPKLRQGATRKSEILNVEGRLHPGGIDVLFDTWEDDGKGGRAPTQTIVTVPWGQVKQAYRSVVGE